MSCAVDELDVNPFFTALQTLYQDKYEKAQEKCYLICIPETSSIQDIQLSPKFADYHILRPSPYFQGEYLTTHSSSATSVKYDDDSSTLKVSGGSDGETSIRVVSEELSYNKAYKQYKILIIERPLDGSFKLKSSKTASSEETPPLPVTASFNECREYLKSNNSCEKAMKELDRSIIQFLNNYIILADYLKDASQRLEKICSRALEMCLKVKEVKRHIQVKECLPWILESYVLGTVHHKVFPVVCEKLTKEEVLLEKQCWQLEGISPEQIGVRPEFSCPLPLAICELSKLSQLQTPREKILCLKATVDSIIQSIRDYWTKKEPPHLQKLRSQEIVEPHLTSDDLLPILVVVIAEARCRHLESDLFYIENFSWSSTAMDRDNLSYCLVTFKAAVEYLKKTDFSHVQGSSKIVHQQNLEAGAGEAEVEGILTESSILDQELDPVNPSLTRMRRQLENISLMTRESAEEEKFKTDQPLLSIFSPTGRSPRAGSSNSNPEQKNNQLGDFLSSLDDFDMTFGKQT